MCLSSFQSFFFTPPPHPLPAISKYNLRNYNSNISSDPLPPPPFYIPVISNLRNYYTNYMIKHLISAIFGKGFIS